MTLILTLESALARAAVVFGCVALTFVSPSAGAQQANAPPLSKVEQKIRDYVRSHEAEQIALLEKANYALLASLDSVSRALGRGPVEALDPGRRGAGDISFVSDYVDALDGLGVIGMRSHTPDERVNLNSIASATERAAILIYRLTRAR